MPQPTVATARRVACLYCLRAGTPVCYDMRALIDGPVMQLYCVECGRFVLESRFDPNPSPVPLYERLPVGQR